MNKIKMRTYSLNYSVLGCGCILKEDSEGLLLDMTDLPEEYEVVIRPLRNTKKEQVIYRNLKERGLNE